MTIKDQKPFEENEEESDDKLDRESEDAQTQAEYMEDHHLNY